MRTWFAVLAVAAGSFGFRAVPLFVPWVASPPAHIERRLTRAGAASLVALAVAATRRQSEGATPGATVAVVAALTIGLLAARRGAAMPVVVVAGIATHAVLTLALEHV
jgi:branched-subunit amino acid transport protein